MRKKTIKIDQNSYEGIVRKEEKIIITLSFSYTIVLFFVGLILFTIALTPKDDYTVLFYPIAFFYFFIFLLVYIPDRFKNINKPILSSNYFFEKLTFERMVIRYEILEKTMIYYIGFFIFVAIIVGMGLYGYSLVKNPTVVQNNASKFLQSLPLIPGMMVYSLFLYRSKLHQYRDFSFNYALGCFKIISKFNSLDDVLRTKYLVDGLNRYDRFLRHNLKLRITKLESLISIIVTESHNTRENIVDEFIIVMECKSKLQFLHHLSGKMDKSKLDSMLRQDNFTLRLKEKKEMITIAITTIGIVVSIMLSLLEKIK